MFDADTLAAKLNALYEEKVTPQDDKPTKREAPSTTADTVVDRSLALSPGMVGEAVYRKTAEMLMGSRDAYEYMKRIPSTDAKVVRLALDTIDGQIMYKEDDGWYVYNGKVFKKVKPSVANAFGNQIAENMALAVQESDDSFFDMAADHKVDMKSYYAKLAKAEAYENDAKDGAITRKLSTALAVLDEEAFDSNRYLVFNNGVLDTVESKERGEIVFYEEHSPHYQAPDRCLINANYVPGAQPGPALERFLTYSFQSYEDGVNCFRGLGIGLFDAGEKRKIVMDLHGKPDSGKSIISRLMNHITGLYRPASRDHFAYGSESNFALVSLEGYKLIFVPEMSRKIDDELVKQWSGADMIDTDVKNGERRQYMPQGIIIFQSNSDDGTGLDVAEEGMKLRYVPVWFPHQFTSDGMTEEGYNENYVKNLGIEEEMRAEADLIVSWMLGLWLEWNKLGIDTLPLTKNQEEIRDRKAGDLKTVDRVIQWYVDKGAIKATDDVGKKSDYLAFDEFSKLYQQFCSARKIEALSDRKLAASMRKDGLAVKHDKLRLPGYVAGDDWARILAELSEF